ncbi:mitochondrial DNA-directed RNA polymeras-like protein [Calycina marina]|uniref:DNA-directed RNA polymerase n=1 Tax=Calycina marina TaxID=1763456 RepID=A0A9P8CH56_9HELO|nr:mitochondrial DNA-directed RNA polymeras-like protein [Calycina marina]
MFIRAVRRPAQPKAISNSIIGGQNCLRRAYPAYNDYRTRNIWTTGDSQIGSSGPRKRRNSNDSSNISTRRTLTDVYTPTSAGIGSDPIPFEYTNDATQSWPSQKSSLADIRPWVETPVQIENWHLGPPQRLRMGPNGTGGDLSEMSAIFRACLRVGRMDRASLLLQRITKFDYLVPENILQLQTEYVQAAILQLIQNPDPSTVQALHQWFDVSVRQPSRFVDDTLMGYMLKASLQSPDHDARERYVARYMSICRQWDLDMTVVQTSLETSIWSADELQQIVRLYPDLNVEELENHDYNHGQFENTDVLPDTNTEPEPAPEVRAAQQKGLGLKALKASLQTFAEIGTARNLSTDERRKLQVRMETNAVDASVDRWREENVNLTKMGLNTALQTKSLAARMWRWQLDLQRALQEELDKVDASEVKAIKSPIDADRCTYGPFLRLLSLEKLSAITILSLMGKISARDAFKGIILGSTIMTIAGDIEDEALHGSVEKMNKAAPWAKTKKTDKMTVAALRKAKRSAVSGGGREPSSNPLHSILAEEMWPVTIKAKIGAVLLSALIQTAKLPVDVVNPVTKATVTQMQPAFKHSHQIKSGRKVGTILPNTALTAQLKREPVHSLLAKHLPMLVEPDPWTEFGKGGFISQPAKVMRIKLGDKEQRHYAEAAIDKGDMEQIFKGLDVLGRTPWKINHAVFDTMLEAWNSGEAIANIAPENPKYDIPPEPVLSEDPLDRVRWVRAVKAIENAKSGMHSERCFQNFQLEIARALRNEVFYFPHNVDFRGRAYPIPPYLNHMGADHCRGLLVFGRGKELGEAGLRWLKIHLANVFGYDKASLEEREAFAGQNIDKIHEAISNPLKGSRWWLTAASPWQFLAACVELKNALECPDPTKYVSNLPVHQDGTCNGLQHYAALGGDALGAQQVNLEPGDRPADVYTAVANMVKDSIATDISKGGPNVAYAEFLKDRITRKVVKQTVMTNVYGVTWVGAKAQVKKALQGLYDDLPQDDNLHPGLLSAYIATKIFEALGTMFQGAHDIQYWLGECAGRISRCITEEQMKQWESIESESVKLPGKSFDGKSWKRFLEDSEQFKTGVVWTSPLLMPVVQPYRITKSKQVTTKMQKINLCEPHTSHPVSKRKQVQGFPPNFIHSLDATHMILSALASDEQGLSFAAVHDSFWTHAADIPALNTILRDSFVRIHEENVIGRLAAEFEARYQNCLYLANVRHGSTLYDQITAFRKSRSKLTGKSKLSELLEERKRCQLLASADPEEVEEGKRMETAGSLYENYAGDADLAEEPEIAGIGLGAMGVSEEKAAIVKDHADFDLDNTNEMINDELGDDVTPFEGTLRKHRGPPPVRTVWVWLPLKFPPIPKKGDYDVSRLKNSQYFFS